MTEIFVFGSNLAGRHGKGAALHAKKYYGAIYGRGQGLQGQSYAIPTKDHLLNTLPLGEIHYHVEIFKTFADRNRGLTFKLTPIGCGLAGYRYEQIGPMFADSPSNVIIPDEFVTYSTPHP